MSNEIASRTILVPRSSVLAILHDPVKLYRLHPFVTNITQDPKDHNLYTVKEKLVVLGFITLSPKLSVKFTAKDDGVEIQAYSNVGGLMLSTRWKVKMQNDESCTVSETILTLDMSPLTRRFVIFMLRKSRKELLERMKRQLEGHGQHATRDPASRSLSARSRTITLLTLVFCFSLLHAYYSFAHACIATAFSLLVINLVSLKRSFSELYGDFHLAFNIPPGVDLSTLPDTEWLNMGYWKDTEIFPRACEALALKLIHSAHSVPGGRVLDVGHACGDSLLLLLLHLDVPRPASLTGITNILSHHARSLERIKIKRPIDSQTCDVTLFYGDAVFRPENTSHPLNPSSSTPPFSTILALDCAYHFKSREVFLRQSFARLSPGGTIALADLAVSKPLAFCLRLMLSKLLSVHPENMITPQIYKAQLKAIGYVNIRVLDISNEVFPGFRKFLKSRGRLWGIFERVVGWWVGAGGLYLIVNASKP